MAMEVMNLQGRAWVFGDNMDTDNIFPTRFGGDPNPQEMAKHAFYDYRPEFSKEAKPGDIIVAGYNFGCGSYRETAATSLKALGINLIIARSFHRAYYRNAINLGIWLITIGDSDFECEDGTIVEADHLSGLVINKKTGQKVTGTPLTGIAAEIVEAGGATSFFRSKVLHSNKNNLVT